MSTISYAQVSRLTEALERPVIQNAISDIVPVSKPGLAQAIYSFTKKIALGFIDLSIDVQRSRDAARTRFPNVRGN